jgi:uncharacterized protein (TIGR00725 family)
MLRKLPIVGVFGAGTALDPARTQLAQDLGAMIARLGAHLLTGAGFGVMAAVAEGFVLTAGRVGWSIGIVPREPDGPFDQPNRTADGRLYPNPFVEIVIRTPLPPHVGDWRTTPTRNHINVLTADAIIALPGGIGTTNELNMAAEYRNERDRPPAERRTILVGPASEFAPSHREDFIHVATLDEAERQVRRVLAAHGFPPEGRCTP